MADFFEPTKCTHCNGAKGPLRDWVIGDEPADPSQPGGATPCATPKERTGTQGEAQLPRSSGMLGRVRREESRVRGSTHESQQAHHQANKHGWRGTVTSRSSLLRRRLMNQLRSDGCHRDHLLRFQTLPPIGETSTKKVDKIVIVGSHKPAPTKKS